MNGSPLLPRALQEILDQALRSFPVVVVTGSRQTGRLLPVEVKASAKPLLADARSLLLFRKEYPDLARAGLLLHTGTETGWIADGVLAAPWWRVI